MTELIQAAGYAALVYLLFNYLITFGSGRPLVEWINPGRRYLPALVVTLVVGAYGWLRVAALRNPGSTQAELLHRLVTEEKAPAEVVGGASMLVFAAAVALLAGWCWWNLPRAPQGFNAKPADLGREYCRALKHYVRWTGGIDFAILCEVRNNALQVIATGSDDREILKGLNRLPGLHTDLKGKHTQSDVAEQKRIWTDFALTLFQKWPTLNEWTYPTRHGKNVAVTLDLRYGAVFVEMVEEEPAPPGGDSVGIFLFAAALNQFEVNNLTAIRCFASLSQAVRHIRTGVMKG